LPSKTRHLVLLVGPTGVGKSLAAVHLARRFQGEIVSCDSIQVYRGFDIGTAKPPPELRQAVPHHLVDVAEPHCQFTAADFVRQALKAIRTIDQRHHLPIIVGGTGLYFKALLSGLFPGPGRDDSLREKLHLRIKADGLESLWRELHEVDPTYARLIGCRDKVRIIRALEVFYLTQKPLSAHFRATRSPLRGFHPLKIGLKLEREELYRRIEARVEKMFEGGLVEEVRSLLARGVRETAPPFRALGYKHVLRHLRGEISLDEAVSLTKKDTRHYAKRQMTWFRKMEGIRWFEADDLRSLEEYLEVELAA